jgi:hypothetical protein
MNTGKATSHGLKEISLIPLADAARLDLLVSELSILWTEVVEAGWLVLRNLNLVAAESSDRRFSLGCRPVQRTKELACLCCVEAAC